MHVNRFAAQADSLNASQQWPQLDSWEPWALPPTADRPPIWLLCTAEESRIRLCSRWFWGPFTSNTSTVDLCRPQQEAEAPLIFISLLMYHFAHFLTTTVNVSLLSSPPRSSSHHSRQNCTFQGLILYLRLHSCMESPDSVSLFSPFLLAASPLRCWEPARVLCVYWKGRLPRRLWTIGNKLPRPITVSIMMQWMMSLCRNETRFSENIYVIMSSGSVRCGNISKNTSWHKVTRIRVDKMTFRSVLSEVYSEPSSAVAQDQIPPLSSATSQHAPGQNDRQTCLFLYIVALFQIFCCVCSPVQTQFISSSSGGARFHFSFALFFMCRTSSGHSRRQSQWTKSSERRQERPISCCARWKNTETLQLAPHLIFSFQTL